MQERILTQPSANLIELLTRKQVAEILNVDLRTVDNRVMNKDIPVYKIGGAIRFKKSDLLQLIENSLKNAV